VSGIELVAGVIAAFFAFGIAAGVLAVIALSALRGHRARGGQRRGSGEYDPNRTRPIGWIPPDRPGKCGDLPPPWPGHRG
jgi:hypothetical protein